MEQLEVLGVRVDALGRDATVERIAALAPGPQPSLVVTLGVEMVMAARRDATFRALVNRAALVVCDTIGILLASRVRGGPLRERVTGVDLIPALARRSVSDERVRLYLLGAAPGIAERAADALRAEAPGARIAGARDGYFREDASAEVAATIRASGASVLLCGLGSPKQERWIDAHLAQTGCGVGIGIGGAFDVLAGNVRRAPAALRRAGLEWLYRLITQPSRWKRQLALPAFAVAAAGEAIETRLRGKR